MNKIPVLLCIDVEPDERAGDPDVPKEWTGFRDTHAFLARMRSKLEAATGSPVHFTWFVRMDPGVAELHGSADWAVVRYRWIFDEITAAGDELGLHVHPWRKDAGARRWIADFADQTWVDTCVRTAFRTFEASLGRPCVCFRFGDGWMSGATLDLIEQLGARFDMTMEPGRLLGKLPGSFQGTWPDYTNVPQQPYRPSATDLALKDASGGRRLLEIPLSAGRVGSAVGAPIRRGTSSSWVIERASAASTGLISASPNPAVATNPAGLAATRLSWTSHGTRAVEVRVGAPDGPIFRKSSGAGEASTGLWVRDGLTFFLQDTSDGLPLTSANTLSTVRVGVVPVATAAPENPYLTLNLGFNAATCCRIMDSILASSATSYLAPVMRSDIAATPALRLNLEETFEHILSHPLVERFVFETPPEFVASFVQSLEQ